MADMALAITVGAARRLDDPRATVEEAREWAQHVGIIGETAYAADSFARHNRIRQDYFPRNEDLIDALTYVEYSYEAERFVLVGTDKNDRECAERAGWEYLTIEEAAEKAGWTLVRMDSGVIGRLKSVLR